MNCIEITEFDKANENDILNKDKQKAIPTTTSIPQKALIENILPLKIISDLARIEGNGKKPIYEIHKWWARRLSAVVRSLIIGILLPGDSTENQFWERFYGQNSIDLTILDCFMGGGTSLVEAKKMNARTIGVDVDPLACFITQKELETCDFNKVQIAFDDILKSVGSRIRSFYITEVGNENYPIINTFWVYSVKCPTCNELFETHPHYKLYYDKKEQIVFCKHCGQVHTIADDLNSFTCSNCKKDTDINLYTYKNGYCYCPNCNDKFRLPGRVNGINSLKMFALEFEKDSKRIFKKVDLKDIKLYDEVSKMYYECISNYFVPETLIPADNRTNTRPMSHGYNYYKDLFNKRQLFSLALIYNEIVKINDIETREWLILAFSDCLASNNILCNYAYGYKKLTPLFGIHAYTVPVRPVENNVWGTGNFGRGSFEKTFKKMLNAKMYCEKTYESNINKNGKTNKIFTGEFIKSLVTNSEEQFYSGNFDSLIINSNSENLGKIRDNTVDIILTDPPYFDNLHYSELADFYYQWIKGIINGGTTNPLIEALYVNGNEKNCKDDYKRRLQKVFTECSKKLKDNGIMVFSYHHNKEDAWSLLGKAIKTAGFIITNVFPIRSEGQSGYHTSENSIKWDSIVVLRKRSFLTYKSGENIEVDLNNKLNYWENYIINNSLDMKVCDYVSFYRSIAVMFYSQYEKNYCLNGLMRKAESKIKKENVKRILDEAISKDLIETGKK